MQPDKNDLKQPTKAFGLHIVRMFSALPKTTEAQVLGKQTLRSGTSVRANYREAAKVRVAQPSLSQQIRKLEAEVGQPLFDRLPRSVVLTEAGRCLVDYARQILASIGDARRCVDELKGEVAGKVAVGAIPTIAPYVLPELVVTFQKHYPDVILEIVEDVTDGITRRIEAGELDVAVASTCRASPTLRCESG